MASTSALPPANITQTLFTQLLTPSAASSSSSSSPLRLDNRTTSEHLVPSIEYSPSRRGTATLTLSSPGSSQTKKTIIQASVHADLTPPRDDRPYEGQINLNINSSLAYGISNASRSNPSAEVAINELERQLDLVLRRSGLIDREALCLKAGQLVWNITINIHLMSVQAGNALEGSVLASIVALQDFRRQDASVEEGGKVVLFDEAERAPLPLPITGGLVAVEVAVFIPPAKTNAAANTEDTENASPREPILLLDPTPLEVLLSSALLTFVLTPNTGQYLLSEKVGRSPVDLDVMNKAMRLAATRAKTIGSWSDKQKKLRDEQVGKDVV
ncbi:unnamed protein product [Sympodiomycopsis kandeliae]